MFLICVLLLCVFVVIVVCLPFFLDNESDILELNSNIVAGGYSKEVLDAQIEDLDFDQTIGSVELSDYENQRADYSLQEDTLIDDKQHDKEKR